MDMHPRVATGTSDVVPARPGEQMFLAVHYVRADKRAQFEQFVRRVHAAAAHLHAEADQHICVLAASEPTEDGAYTYMFLMDPLIAGVDVGLDSLLTRFYGAEHARQIFDELGDAFVKDGLRFTVTPCAWD